MDGTLTLMVFGREEDRAVFMRGVLCSARAAKGPAGATGHDRLTLNGVHTIQTVIVRSCDDAKLLLGIEPDAIILHESYRRCEKCQAIFAAMLEP